MADAGYSRFVTITKSDTLDIDGNDTTKPMQMSSLPDGIIVNASAAGKTAILIDVAGNSTTLTVQAAGCFFLPLRVRRVGASSTAESFIAVYR
jgi:hypothetical protein